MLYGYLAERRRFELQQFAFIFAGPYLKEDAEEPRDPFLFPEEDVPDDAPKATPEMMQERMAQLRRKHGK